MALFFTAVVIESMVDPDEGSNFWLYFIYMTNWGIMMCMITNVYAAILVTIWHFHPEYAGEYGKDDTKFVGLNMIGNFRR